jgi:hypothetical protein
VRFFWLLLSLPCACKLCLGLLVDMDFGGGHCSFHLVVGATKVIRHNSDISVPTKM